MPTRIIKASKEAIAEVNNMLTMMGYPETPKGIPQTIEELTDFWLYAKTKLLKEYVDELTQSRKELLSISNMVYSMEKVVDNLDLDMKLKSNKELMKKLEKDLKTTEESYIEEIKVI